MKPCSICKIEKPLSEFTGDNSYKANSDKHRSSCKVCDKKKRALNKPWREAYHRKYKYNLTNEEYLALRVKQGDRCALCGNEGKLIVDHCHVTGKIRGLLCFKCNTGLGQLGDNVVSLQRAINYLEEASNLQ